MTNAYYLLLIRIKFLSMKSSRPHCCKYFLQLLIEGQEGGLMIKLSKLFDTRANWDQARKKKKMHLI